jgi:hypothetical protein
MSTPASRAVLEAALRWREDISNADAQRNLLAAVDHLAAERGEQRSEYRMTYGELVSTDMIQSMNGRWYEVDRLAADPDQTSVKVWLKGIAKPLEKFRGQEVMVRRSATGQAADMLAAVLWSGPTPGIRKESVA